jgi:hypothetical protein
VSFSPGDRVQTIAAYPSGWRPAGVVKKVTPSRVVVEIDNRPAGSMGARSFLNFDPKNIELVDLSKTAGPVSDSGSR